MRTGNTWRRRFEHGTDLLGFNRLLYILSSFFCCFEGAEIMNAITVVYFSVFCLKLQWSCICVTNIGAFVHLFAFMFEVYIVHSHLHYHSHVLLSRSHAHTFCFKATSFLDVDHPDSSSGSIYTASGFLGLLSFVPEKSCLSIYPIQLFTRTFRFTAFSSFVVSK